MTKKYRAVAFYLYPLGVNANRLYFMCRIRTHYCYLEKLCFSLHLLSIFSAYKL